MSSKDTDRLVETSAEIADLPGVLFHRLLLPAVRHGSQQGDERGRAGRDDVLVEPEAKLDERGILFECRAEEHLTGQKHHHEVWAGMDVRGVAFGGELR